MSFTIRQGPNLSNSGNRSAEKIESNVRSFKLQHFREITLAVLHACCHTKYLMRLKKPQRKEMTQQPDSSNKARSSHTNRFGKQEGSQTDPNTRGLYYKAEFGVTEVKKLSPMCLLIYGVGNELHTTA